MRDLGKTHIRKHTHTFTDNLPAYARHIPAYIHASMYRSNDAYLEFIAVIVVCPADTICSVL